MIDPIEQTIELEVQDLAEDMHAIKAQLAAIHGVLLRVEARLHGLAAEVRDCQHQLDVEALDR